MAVKKWIGGSAGNTTNAGTAANYLPSGVPANGDDVFVEGNPSGTDYSIATGLTTFESITLNSFNVAQSYTGLIGVAATGTNSTTTGYLSLSGTNTAAITINIGYQTGGTSASNGSTLIRLNTGSALTTWNISNSASSSSIPNAGPITLLGTHTSNALNIISGIVSVAVDPTETAKILTLNNKGNLSLGSSLTLTTINHNGGTILVRSGVTTFNQTAGTATFNGNGTANTMNIYGGSAVLSNTGTITALNIYAATVDMSRNPAARTITTVTGYAGGTFNLNNGVKNSITVTNPIVNNAGAGKFTIIPWVNSATALS